MLTSKHVQTLSWSLVSARSPETSACVTDYLTSVSRLLDKPETNKLDGDAAKQSAFCVQSLITSKLTLTLNNIPAMTYTD